MLIAKLAVILVAVLHLGFMLLEMLLWTRPVGRKLFALDPQFAAQSARLAANQGLYNGLLAAGLIYGLSLGAAGTALVEFLLAAIIIAGIYGAISVKAAIFWIQAVPAMLALILFLV